jgi:hypothetical protein
VTFQNYTTKGPKCWPAAADGAVVPIPGVAQQDSAWEVLAGAVDNNTDIVATGFVVLTAGGNADIEFDLGAGLPGDERVVATARIGVQTHAGVHATAEFGLPVYVPGPVRLVVRIRHASATAGNVVVALQYQEAELAQERAITAPPQDDEILNPQLYPKCITAELTPPFTSDKDVARLAALVDLKNGQRLRAVVVLSWKAVETADGVYSWTAYNNLVDWAHNNDIDLHFVIKNVPQWASGNADPLVPPTDPTDFANFAGVAVGRYGPYGTYVLDFENGWCVKHWSIWDGVNEDMNPTPNSATYAAILVESYDAMKAKSPIIFVYVGSLSLGGVAPVTWMGGIHSNGGTNKYSRAAITPFSGNTVTDAVPHIQSLRTFLNANGRSDAKILVTWGMPASAGDAAGLARQAEQNLQLFNERGPDWRADPTLGVSEVVQHSLADDANGDTGVVDDSDDAVPKEPGYGNFKVAMAADRDPVYDFPKFYQGSLGGAEYTDPQRASRFPAFIDSKGERDQRLIVRAALDWFRVEPTQGNFLFHQDGFGWDGLVDFAFQNGIELWVTIEGTPSWARAPGHDTFSPPTDPQYYADFAEVCVQRYAPGGSFVSGYGNGNWGVRLWCLENELNLMPAHINWTPQFHAQCHVAAYDAMKAVTTDIRVAASALANDGGPAWLRDFLNHASNPGAHMDSQACNPYSGDDVAAAGTHLAKYRNRLDGEGFTNVELDITEWGVGAHHNNPTRMAKQAALVLQYFNELRPVWRTLYKLRYASYFPLTATESVNSDDTPWGLSYDDFQGPGPDDNLFTVPKPAYYVFRDGIYCR